MWSPDQYERFDAARAQPFHDLLALVERRPHMRIADLGCGTGALTSQLHATLDAEETIGVDSSAEMLAKAIPHATGTLHFELKEIEHFAGADLDLLFSNAALQWIPGHEHLLPRLISLLGSGGQLAVQMPCNDDHPSHRVAREVAAAFDLVPQRAEILPPERYASILHAAGMARHQVRVQVYGHQLPSADGVVEWVKGSILTEYRKALTPGGYDEFVNEYSRRLMEELRGEERVGEHGAEYFYTFKRVLIWGSR